jgi:hypothetical protein
MMQSDEERAFERVSALIEHITRTISELGGRVVSIDYHPKPMSERPWGPPPEQQFPKEQMDREMSAAGFRVSKAFDFLPEQFFVIYVPQ